MPQNKIRQQKISRISAIMLLFLVLPGFVLQGCIGVKPKAPQAAALEDGGIFRSPDDGKTWQQKVKIDELNNISNVNIISLAIDSKDDLTIFAGSEGQGLFKTIDGGDYWQKFSDEYNGPLTANAIIKYILIDPRDSNNIYLIITSGKDKIVKSGDGGNVWQEVYTSNDPSTKITSLSIDNFDNSVVYIATSQGGLFKGINYGTDWRLVKWLSPGFDISIIAMAINPKDTRIIYLAASDGLIYKTADKGNTWIKLFKDAPGNTGFGAIASLIIDPVNPSILYAGTSAGLLKSTDNGKTWFNIPTITTTNIAPIDTVAINPVNPQVLYYGIGSMIYKTIDGGIHWEIYNAPTSRIIKTIIVDPITASNVYIGTYKVIPPTKQKKPFQIMPDFPVQ